MKLGELTALLRGEFLCGEDRADFEIDSTCAGDLLSDILVYSRPHALLLTGLVNLQVVRTAEMLDMGAVAFIRGKRPTSDMLALARSKGIPLLTTPMTMFSGCAVLSNAGLKDIEEDPGNPAASAAASNVPLEG